MAAPRAAAVSVVPVVRPAVWAVPVLTESVVPVVSAEWPVPVESEVPVLLLCGILELYVGPPDPMAEQLTSANLVQIATGILSIIAVCSMAVSWHRFILIDEVGHGLRFGGPALREAAAAEIMPRWRRLVAAEVRH